MVDCGDRAQAVGSADAGEVVSHWWDSACADTWAKYDLTTVAEWARHGAPTMADVFGKVHQSVTPLTSLAPFKLWHSNADLILRRDLFYPVELQGLYN